MKQVLTVGKWIFWGLVGLYALAIFLDIPSKSDQFLVFAIALVLIQLHILGRAVEHLSANVQRLLERSGQ